MIIVGQSFAASLPRRYPEALYRPLKLDASTESGRFVSAVHSARAAMRQDKFEFAIDRYSAANNISFFEVPNYFVWGETSFALHRRGRHAEASAFLAAYVATYEIMYGGGACQEYFGFEQAVLDLLRAQTCSEENDAFVFGPRTDDEAEGDRMRAEILWLCAEEYLGEPCKGKSGLGLK